MPCDGETIQIGLFAAPANSTATLLVGVAELGVPFKGGVLVPDPSPTGLFGIVQLSLTWPAGVPSGFQTFLQYWIPSPGPPSVVVVRLRRRRRRCRSGSRRRPTR